MPQPREQCEVCQKQVCRLCREHMDACRCPPRRLPFPGERPAIAASLQRIEDVVGRGGAVLFNEGTDKAIRRLAAARGELDALIAALEAYPRQEESPCPHRP